jgi:hypothetical protein
MAGEKVATVRNRDNGCVNRLERRRRSGSLSVADGRDLPKEIARAYEREQGGAVGLGQ